MLFPVRLICHKMSSVWLVEIDQMFNVWTLRTPKTWHRWSLSSFFVAGQQKSGTKNGQNASLPFRLSHSSHASKHVKTSKGWSAQQHAVACCGKSLPIFFSGKKRSSGASVHGWNNQVPNFPTNQLHIYPLYHVTIGDHGCRQSIAIW